MKKEKLTLCLFNKSQTKEIAKMFGFDLRETHCCICKKRVTTENLGHFVHYEGKRAVICTNTKVCFLMFMIHEKPGVLGLGQKKKPSKKK